MSEQANAAVDGRRSKTPCLTLVPRSPASQLKSVHFVLNELFREHRLFEDRFDKLEEQVRFDERRTPTATFVSQCQRWIADEQVYLLERIEKLEDENHRLHANYQLEHDRCLETLTDRMLADTLGSTGQCFFALARIDRWMSRRVCSFFSPGRV